MAAAGEDWTDEQCGVLVAEWRCALDGQKVVSKQTDKSQVEPAHVAAEDKAGVYVPDSISAEEVIVCASVSVLARPVLTPCASNSVCISASLTLCGSRSVCISLCLSLTSATPHCLRLLTLCASSLLASHSLRLSSHL